MIDRNLRRSLFDYCKSLLLTPPSGTFNANFNVYTAIRDQYRNTSFVPTRPFVFMVDRNIEPTTSRVPLIVIEVEGLAKAAFELGNRNGHLASVNINIFGDTRGMRDDLTSLYRDYFGLTFPILDYTTSGSPSLGYAELLDEPTSVQVSVGEDVAEEGSLYNFNVVSFDIVTKI